MSKPTGHPGLRLLLAGVALLLGPEAHAGPLAPAALRASLAGSRLTLAEDTPLVRGGSTEKYLLVDRDQRQWIFKPMTPASAYTEEAGFRVARLLGLPTPEVFQVRTPQGVSGSLSRVVPAEGNLREKDPASLDERQLGQLLEIEVFRWLIGDFDTHARNFLEVPGGDVWTIDHGRAWRDHDYFRYDLAAGPARDRISYFGAMWRAHLEGRVRLPLARGVAFASRAAAVPWEKLEAILAPLARLRVEEQGYVLGDHLGVQVHREPREFLFAVRRRQERLVEDVRAYYERMTLDGVGPGLEALAPRDPTSAGTAGIPESPEDLDDAGGEPLAIELHDPQRRLNFVKRLGRKLGAIVGVAREAGPDQVVRRVVQLADASLDSVEYRLGQAAYRGLTLDQVARLDLERLPGGPAFLGRLQRTRPEVVERLRGRLDYLAVHAESDLARLNAARLASWVEHFFPGGS